MNSAEQVVNQVPIKSFEVVPEPVTSGQSHEVSGAATRIQPGPVHVRTSR
jgi:hypothetical protein